MTNPDYRALCADLLAAIDSYMQMDGNDTTPIPQKVARLMEAKRQCIAALTQPEPEPPLERRQAAGDRRYRDRTWLPHNERRSIARREFDAPNYGFTLADLAATLIADSKQLNPEVAAVLTPEALWDLYGESPTSQPEPQRPTDEELDEFVIYWWGSEIDERSVSDVIECGSMAAYARAVLARWNHPATQPAPAPTVVPVAVAERPWEREGWCDKEGQCWWFNPGQPAMSDPHIATSSWRLCRMLSGKPMGSYLLPHNAIPLPEADQ